MVANTHDFTVNDQGSIVLLVPLTPQAETWVKDNLPEDRLTFGLSVVIEHRYADDIIQGIINDGLRIR